MTKCNIKMRNHFNIVAITKMFEITLSIQHLNMTLLNNVYLVFKDKKKKNPKLAIVSL